MTPITAPPAWKPNLDVATSDLPELLADQRADIQSREDILRLGTDALAEILARRQDRQALGDLIAGCLVPPSAFNRVFGPARSEIRAPLLGISMELLLVWGDQLSPDTDGDDCLAVLALERLVASTLVVLTARGEMENYFLREWEEFTNTLRAAAKAVTAAEAESSGRRHFVYRKIDQPR